MSKKALNHGGATAIYYIECKASGQKPIASSNASALARLGGEETG
jgi:hypothetical protein